MPLRHDEIDEVKAIVKEAIDKLLAKLAPVEKQAAPTPPVVELEKTVLAANHNESFLTDENE